MKIFEGKVTISGWDIQLVWSPPLSKYCTKSANIAYMSALLLRVNRRQSRVVFRYILSSSCSSSRISMFAHRSMLSLKSGRQQNNSEITKNWIKTWGQSWLAESCRLQGQAWGHGRWTAPSAWGGGWWWWTSGRPVVAPCPRAVVCSASARWAAAPPPTPSWTCTWSCPTSRHVGNFWWCNRNEEFNTQRRLQHLSILRSHLWSLVKRDVHILRQQI